MASIRQPYRRIGERGGSNIMSLPFEANIHAGDIVKCTLLENGKLIIEKIQE